MNYIQIEKTNISCGPGIRVVLWVSGCNVHCDECHNQETWDPNVGQPFTDAAFEELIEALKPNYISGITFCGGEPMHPANAATIKTLAIKIRRIFGNTKTIWCYTGHQYEDYSWFLENMDVVIDGPYRKALRDITLAWRGSSNQRIIDVQKTMQTGQITLVKEIEIGEWK